MPTTLILLLIAGIAVAAVYPNPTLPQATPPPLTQQPLETPCALDLVLGWSQGQIPDLAGGLPADTKWLLAPAR